MNQTYLPVPVGGNAVAGTTGDCWGAGGAICCGVTTVGATTAPAWFPVVPLVFLLLLLLKVSLAIFKSSSVLFICSAIKWKHVEMLLLQGWVVVEEGLLSGGRPGGTTAGVTAVSAGDCTGANGAPLVTAVWCCNGGGGWDAVPSMRKKKIFLVLRYIDWQPLKSYIDLISHFDEKYSIIPLFSPA